MHNIAGEIDHGYEGGAESQWGIALGVLHCMAAFVCCNGRSCDAPLAIDAFAEVHRHSLGIEVVCQLPGNAGYIYIINSIVFEHLPGDFRSCEHSVVRNLRVLLEFALKYSLDDVAGYHHENHYQPNVHFFSSIVRFYGNIAGIRVSKTKPVCLYDILSQETLFFSNFVPV